MTGLTHIKKDGTANMVDISDKEITSRIATASGMVRLRPETVAVIRARQTPKGDPLETARLAGIMAAKRTAELVPLCHPLLLDHVDVAATLDETGVSIASEVRTTGKTGAEMEALTAVSVAALCVYDMCKAIEKGITIDAIRLESKDGGKSGAYKRVT